VTWERVFIYRAPRQHAYLNKGVGNNILCAAVRFHMLRNKLWTYNDDAALIGVTTAGGRQNFAAKHRVTMKDVPCAATGASDIDKYRAIYA